MASRLLARSTDEIAPLVKAISRGHFYAAEEWIRSSQPVQAIVDARDRRSHTSPLEAALRTGQFDLVRLLLDNGYDTSLELYSPFSLALGGDRLDLVELLFERGVDASSTDPHDVIRSYDIPTMERFWRSGLDFRWGNALSGAAAYSTRNKPLYGFLKRHASGDPRLQLELDRGLCMAVGRRLERERSLKAVSLCIWAGADPWAPVAWDTDDAEDDDPADDGSSDETEEGEPRDAFWTTIQSAAGIAALHGSIDLLRAMKLKRSDARIQALYPFARDAATFDYLSTLQPLEDAQETVAWILRGVAGGSVGSGRPWEALDVLKCVFDAGHRLDDLEEWQTKLLTRWLRSASEWHAKDCLRLLQNPRFVGRPLLTRILRSPKLLARSEELRLNKASLELVAKDPGASQGVRAAAKRELRARRPRRRSRPRPQ